MPKSVLKALYNYGTLTAEKRDFYQKNIRDAEWAAIKQFIPPGSRFLDIGCGAGYNLVLAKEIGCEVFGIDPNPYLHGVGRVDSGSKISNPLNIIQGSADKLPFQDQSFHVLYCSHVLEHIRNKDAALNEFKRLLKPDGVLLLGMPTATMAWINLFSQLVFNTHKRILHVIRSLIEPKKESRYRLVNLIVPRSHSFADKTIFYDLHYYRIGNWKNIISDYFDIDQILLPALYPYPDFIQLFKLRKSEKYSSSVFFVCSRKKTG